MILKEKEKKQPGHAATFWFLFHFLLHSNTVIGPCSYNSPVVLLRSHSESPLLSQRLQNTAQVYSAVHSFHNMAQSLFKKFLSYTNPLTRSKWIILLPVTLELSFSTHVSSCVPSLY